MTRHLIFVDGTGEKQGPDSFAERLLRPYIRSTDKISHLRYRNQIGPVGGDPRTEIQTWFRYSSLQARNDGVTSLVHKLIAADNDDVVVIGYSLGAWVVSEFLEAKARGQYPNAKLRAAITIGSPRRHADKGYTGQGIAGPHGAYPLNVAHVEIGNYNDIVSNTPAQSVLSTLPYVSDVLTLNFDYYTRLAWVAFGKKLLSGRTSPRMFTDRDLQLLNAYVDGTGHAEEYFRNKLWRPALRVLG